MSAALARRLVERGLLTQSAVARALREVLRTTVPLLQQIAEERPDLLEPLAALLPPVELAGEAWEVHLGLWRELPPGLCEQLLAFPIALGADGVADVVAADASDPHVERELVAHLRRAVRLHSGELSVVLRRAGARLVESDGERPAVRVSGRVSLSERPIPLVKRATSQARQRIPTSPGLGRERTPQAPHVARAAAHPALEASRAPQPAAGTSLAPPTQVAVPRPQRSAPSQSVPSQSVPSQSVPPQSVPSQSVPPRRAPSQSVPSQSVPSQSVPPRRAPAPLSELRAALQAADHAEEIAQILARCSGGGSVVFAVRPDVLVARAVADEAQRPELSVSRAEPSVLRVALELGRYVGPLFDAATHGPLFRWLTPGEPVIVEVVSVRQRPALVLLTPVIGDEGGARQRAAQAATAARAALEAVIVRRKRSRHP